MDNPFLLKTLNSLCQQIKYLQINEYPGLCQDISSFLEKNNFPAWINRDFSSIDFQLEDTLEYEDLIVTLPYAGTNLTIKIHFNIDEPWNAPDFNISDMKFMKGIKIDDLEQMVPCLNDWNFLRDDILAQFCLQIYLLYKKYQIECLEEEELLLFEYQSLFKTLDIGEEDVEISLTGGNSWTLSLLIRLPLRLNNIPPSLINANPGPPVSLLHVSLKKNNKSFTPKLYLSPQVESLIGNSDDFSLPVVPATSSVSDFALNILGLLENRAKTAVFNFEMRKQLVAQLLCLYGTALLEYDGKKFSKIAFLFDAKNFYFMLIIDIPDDFPNRCPELTLHSIYPVNSKGTMRKQLEDIDFPKESTPESVADAIHRSLTKFVPDFKSFAIQAKS